MKNIMLDIEALDSGQKAAIISLGMVYFDIEKQELGPKLYVEMTLDALREQLNEGHTLSLSTTQWWMQQSDDARSVWKTKDTQLSNKDVFRRLKEYFELFPEHGRNIRVWGNGSTYDNVCLQNYYRTFKQRIPWNYRGDMCYRTIKALFGHRCKVERTGTHHNGLDDAATQAVHLLGMLRGLRGVV